MLGKAQMVFCSENGVRDVEGYDAGFVIVSGSWNHSEISPF